MKMKKSNTIKIGNRVFSIMFIDDESFNHYLTKNDQNFDENFSKEIHKIKSFINYDESLIVIREKLDNDYKNELLIHELLHAELDVNVIPQDEKTEEIISILAPRIYSLFKNGLLKFLK